MEANPSLCSFCQSVISTTKISTNNVTIKHHANAKCLSESAESGCPLCALVWDAFSSSKGLSELVHASTTPENSLKFPFLQFHLQEYDVTNVMQYHFELAFEQSSDYQKSLYIDSKWDLPAANICVIPVSEDIGDTKLFSKFLCS
jgi:hypothetical protein